MLVIPLEKEWKVEKEIFIQKNYQMDETITGFITFKKLDAANELSKEIDRMKSPSPKEGGKVKRNVRLEKNVERRKQREKEKNKNALKKNN